MRSAMRILASSPGTTCGAAAESDACGPFPASRGTSTSMVASALARSSADIAGGNISPAPCMLGTTSWTPPSESMTRHALNHCTCDGSARWGSACPAPTSCAPETTAAGRRRALRSAPTASRTISSAAPLVVASELYNPGAAAAVDNGSRTPAVSRRWYLETCATLCGIRERQNETCVGRKYTCTRRTRCGSWWAERTHRDGAAP